MDKSHVDKRHNDGWKIIRVWFPPEDHAQIKACAKAHDITMAALVRSALKNEMLYRNDTAKFPNMEAAITSKAK